MLAKLKYRHRRRVQCQRQQQQQEEDLGRAGSGPIAKQSGADAIGMRRQPAALPPGSAPAEASCGTSTPDSLRPTAAPDPLLTPRFAVDARRRAVLRDDHLLSATVDTMFVLQRILAERDPDGREVVTRVMANASGLLRCFVGVSGGDAEAAAALVLAYASWCAAGLAPSDDVRPLTASGAPLLDIIEPESPADDGAGRPVVAVVRDVRVLGLLLDDFSLDEVVGSHVARLERLLLSSAAARRHGVGIVQDLSEMSLSLVTRMLEPRALLTQSRAARFLIGAFPCTWASVVIVDAPMAFGGLWRVVRNFFPADFADSVRFVYRPDAARELKELFGRPVL